MNDTTRAPRVFEADDTLARNLATVAEPETLCKVGGASTSTQDTRNNDARVVGGDNSQNLSVAGNSGPVSIALTDHGAVSGALQLALAGVEGANKTAQQTVSTQGSLLTGALTTVSQQQQGFTAAIEQIKTGDKTTMILVGGVAIVAVAAAAFLQRKG